MARVHVLLSTFNGEAYLGELLDSLVAQSHQELFITIRDDGSTDATWDIVERFGRSHPRAEISRGHNLGPADSYLELLRGLPASADCFCFCDQDDVWDRDKVAAAAGALSAYRDRPALYFSRLRITDASLRPRRLSAPPARPPRLENALAQNIVTGCASMVNRPGIDLLQASLPPPARIRMHDWWTYQVLSSIGDVVYDPEPRISYRQHSANVVGNPGRWAKWTRRLARTRTRRGQLLGHATLLRAALSTRLSEDRRALLNGFIEGLGSRRISVRARYAARMPVYRQTRLDTLILRLLIVAGMA